MKRVWILWLLLVAIAVPAWAVDDGVLVDEVLRRGNMVESVVPSDGLVYGESELALYAEAMEPPESDEHKWFISVITTSGCAGCTDLQRKWQKTPELLAFADPSDAQRSWSHYTVYNAQDASQTWRFGSLEVSQFPTVIVQPPRTGEYGDPSTIVCQTVYTGDPKALAVKIRNAIQTYLATNPAEPVAMWPSSIPFTPSEPTATETPVGTLFPNLQRTIEIPPIDTEVSIAFPWQSLLLLVTGGFSLSSIIGLILWGLVKLRNYRKSSGSDLVLSDEQFNKLIDTFKPLAGIETTETK